MTPSRPQCHRSLPRYAMLVLVSTLACAACTSTSSAPVPGPPPSSSIPTPPAGALKVVIFKPTPNQAVGGVGLYVSNLQLKATVRDGYACFTMDGRPLIWPAGFSAVKNSRGQLTVRTSSGLLLNNGDAYQLSGGEVSSTGSPCSAKGSDVMSIDDHVKRGLPRGLKLPHHDPSPSGPPWNIPLPGSATSVNAPG